MGQMIYLKDVVTLKVDEGKCVGCGVCGTVCPHAVMVMSDGHASIGDRDSCMECGACARNCPTGAVTVQAGGGCAAAVINAALNRENASCCAIEADENVVEEAAKRGGIESRPTNCC